MARAPARPAETAMDVAGVRAAEAALRSAGLAGANALPALLDATTSADDATATAALHASRRSLARLTTAAAVAAKTGDESGAVVAAWLATRTAEWHASLPALALRRAPSPPPAAADDDAAAAVDAAAGDRRLSSDGGAGPGVGVADAALAVAAAAGAAAWRPVAAAVLCAVPPVPAATTLNEAFVGVYDDVKLWTLEVGARLCRERTAREGVAAAAGDTMTGDAQPPSIPPGADASSATAVPLNVKQGQSTGGGQSPVAAAATTPLATPGADGVVENVLAMLGHAVIPLPAEARAWTPVMLSTKLGGARPPQRPRESRKRKAHLPPSGMAGPTDVEILPYKALRAAYSDCWLAALGAPTRPGGGGELDKLLPLAGTVLPRLAAPLQLADYLTAAYDRGGPASIVALDGLYTLIRDHGLDYPTFYSSLYARLTPDTLFYARRRQAFLAAVPTFLAAGGYLPAAVIAAFVKRLARLALVAPPHGAMWCLRLALELVRKHPAVSVLLHRRYVDGGAALGAGGVLTPAPAFTSFFEPPPPTPSASGAATAKGAAAATGAAAAVATATTPYVPGGADVYDAAATDPAAARALDSCLWELGPLRAHFSPAVAAVAAAFTTDVTAVPQPRPPPGDVADMADLSFADVFHAEFDKRRSLTPLAYAVPAVGDGTALGGVLRWR
ncbi:hypothetical protein MMPV_008667 [Pyropia vietnamensis]